MKRTAVDNIMQDIPDVLAKELINSVFERQEFKLERIVSSGQRTAANTWYDRKTHEWVMVIVGRARLAFEHEKEPVCLGPGDHLLIPAHVRHRVEWTDPCQKTVWLALHFRPAGPEGQQPGLEADDRLQRVEVVRSSRRRKTVTARLLRNTMYVHVPSGISAKKLTEIIGRFKNTMRRKMLKSRLNREHNLREIADRLNKRFFEGTLQINHIEYVTDQFSKFGCCDYRSKSIRIAHHVAEMPEWVRDYVIVHELAHLIQPDHSPAFWELVNRYRYVERAKGFLLAKGYELNEEQV